VTDGFSCKNSHSQSSFARASPSAHLAMDARLVVERVVEAYDAAHAAARVVLRERLAVDDDVYAHALIALMTIVCLYIASRVVFGRKRGRKNIGKPAVVVVGCVGSGKTALWQALTYGEQRFATVSSAAPNERDAVSVKGKTRGGRDTTKHGVCLVDVPGHGRLRSEAMQQLKRAKAVVYLVDSVTFASNRKEVARFLYEILCDEAVQRKGTPIMVACNKCEKLTAHPPDFIRKRLEREIEATRAADAGAPPPLAITPAQKKANAIAMKKRARARSFGQRPGEAFTFEAFSKFCRAPPVAFDRVSATKLQTAPIGDFIVRL